MPLEFIGSPSMTLGVELELQIIDAKTKDLFPGSPKIFQALGGEREHIKPELVQAMIEVNSGICDTVSQVRSDLHAQLDILGSVCDKFELTLAGAGSHPFARYSDRIVYPSERYKYLIDRNRWIARRLMIFGLHVHVGMRDTHHAIAMNNAMLHYIPHVLGLSASSPFWQATDTGLASWRVTIFEALPTGGHPCTFDSWDQFVSFYDSMIASKSISSIKDIWWDIRPHPKYGTVELRVCDGLPTIEETLSIVSLVQCLYAWFDDLYQNGTILPPPPYWILRENKWKASRYGLEAEIILDEKGKTGLLRKELETLLVRLQPYARQKECREELDRIAVSLQKGCSYERQKRIFEKEGTFLAVTEALVEEFKTGEPIHG